MKFAIEIEPTYTVIAPNADTLDKGVAEALLAKIKEGLEANAVSCYIVDLSAVSFLPNESIHPLMCIQEAVEKEGVTLVLTNLQELVVQKIKQERLHLSIHITSTMDDALAFINDVSATPEVLNEI